MAKKKKKNNSAPKYDPTSYAKATAPTAPAAYTPTQNTVGNYTPTQNTVGSYKPVANTVGAYQPGTYKSQYEGQIAEGLSNLTNWKYDPLQDASYQALAKVYGERGNIAAKNTLADAAALNGGYGTSYAVSAAQQARNQYNQELAMLIPDLEQNAYNRAQTTYSLLKDADDTAYGRFRDTEGDRQWKYQQDYQAYRDREADNQWKYGMDYQAYRDREADNQFAYQQAYNAYRDRESDNQWAYSQNYQRYSDALANYQWARNFDLDLYQLKQAEKKSSGGGGGGGGRRRSGGGGGYSGGSASSGSSGLSAEDLLNAAKGSGKKSTSGNPNSVMAYKSSGGKTQKQSVSEAVARTQSKKKKL